MGLFTSVSGEVRIVAAPFCSLSLTPQLVEVRKGDLDAVARFKVGIAWEPEYTKPIYLLVAGFSGGTFYLPGDSGTVGVDLTVPGADWAMVENGVQEVDLFFNLTGMDINSIPFEVHAFEDEPVPYVA
jgi:hypothetical protein